MEKQDIFDAIEDFNVNIIGINRILPSPIEDESEFGFFVGCLKEEIEELEEAHGQDFIAEIDAVIDLIYFAVGGLCRMGIPARIQRDIFTAVHSANMQKAAGKKEAREKAHSLDAVKPEGWESPEQRIIEIIEAYNCKMVDTARKVDQ
jgi:predicted HAD superfamily Cof-like phosphohydrolase